MRGFKLKDVWKTDHTKAFVALKAQLISEPVLSAPVYDASGTPFILTTDGSKDAFAGGPYTKNQNYSTRRQGSHLITSHHVRVQKNLNVREEIQALLA